jgi:2'-5' RNA ligase
MLPGDRLVCAFVEPHTKGETFRKWLLHVTIVPWFRLPDASDAIAQGLEQALKSIGPFKATIDGETIFGPRKNRPAMLIDPPTPFIEIERKVRGFLHKKRAWLVDETTKKQYEFRPHVTVQGEKKLNSGDTFLCDKLYIVEQKGDYKEIVGEVKLGDGNKSFQRRLEPS